MNNIIQMYNQLRKNPMSILTKRFNIPDSVNMNDPNAIIQHLINTNQVSQTQVNNCMQMKNNPMIQQIFGQMK
jgi:hypothetical protein